jgi:hypothetical protein
VPAVAAASVLGWAVPALLMLGRGFTVRDEGTYLVSYRFWDTNPYFVSGAQYFYGPLFELADESVPALRLLRLVMLLGCNLFFAVAFVRWLPTRPGRALAAYERNASVAVLVAAGGMAYLWAPLTPGYYDLAAECSLVLAGLLLLALRDPAGYAAVWPVVGGAVSVLLVVTKWSAAGVIAIVLVTAVVALRGTPRAGVRFAAWFAVGVLLTLVALHLFLVPLGDLASTMLDVSRASATGSHATLPALQGYAEDAAVFGIGAVVLAVPSLLGTLTRRTWAIVVGALVTGVLPPLLAGWRGGDGHGKIMVAVVLAALVGAVVPAARPHLPRGPGAWMALVLLLVPLAQAGGSTVPLTHLVGSCLAPWVAVVVLLAVLTPRPAWAEVAVWVNLAVAVVAVAAIGGSTTLMTPFASDGHADDTVTVPSLGLKVSPREASEYAALVGALTGHVTPGETPMVTLDRKAGLTYLLGGVQLGSAWTDVETPERTGGLIELDCRRRDRPPPAPVLLVDRPVDDALVRALRACGASYPDEYEELPVPGGPAGLTVYVPR